MRLALALMLTAAPAAAETWACTLTQRCATGYECRAVEDGRATIVIAPDGATAAITVDDETETFRKIAEATVGRTYMVELEGSTVGFMTLYGDGTLAMSAHEIDEGDISAFAAEGTCERTDG